jgi:ABC-type Mn2+/Zn2+ transport system ATPase subunit
MASPSRPPAGHGPAHLEVADLTVRLAPDAPPAVQDISFAVPEGTRVALVGPNGAGKSTLFRAMIGLVGADSGAVRVHGVPFGHSPDCIAYVPQREAVDWRFPVSVTDVVLMGRYGHVGWFRRPGLGDRRIARGCLERLGLLDLADRPIGELSGGQQQRVFLARALAQEPHILLLDEPFTGVDAGTQERVLDLLDELSAQHVTVLVATHDLSLAAERFERVLLLNRSLVAYGPAAEVFTPARVAAAFGHQALFLDGLLVVDPCCAPSEVPADRPVLTRGGG